MKKTLLTLLAIISSAILLKAQTDVDAMRYSGNSVTGTSRFTSMAGSFGAIGGDFSCLSYNPAGIGIYRSSEFTFTPSIFTKSTTSYFQGNSFDERKYNFNIGNMGLIYTNKVSNDDSSPGWKSWNFGLGYTRLTDFHTRSFYEGGNQANSLLDHFSQNASGTNSANLDPFYELLAYNTYLINPDSNNVYSSVIPNGHVIQRRSQESRGAIGETVFTFGGNYSNKIYVGATLGIKSLRYIQSSGYEELDPDTQVYDFTNFELAEDYTTRGTGVDLKFGIIYRANDLVRIGAAVHTPTWYSLHDEYTNSMSSKFETGTVTSYSDKATGSFDYDFTAPFSAIGSVGFVFGKLGLLNAEYEFTDYSTARFDAGSNSFADVNNYIRKKYTAVNTFRIGTEWLYQNVSFRGGYAMSTSPLQTAYKAGTSDFSSKSFTGGIGFRDSEVFFDLGYAYTLTNEFYQPYTLNNQDVPGVKSRVVSSNFVATIGVKF